MSFEFREYGLNKNIVVGYADGTSDISESLDPDEDFYLIDVLLNMGATPATHMMYNIDLVSNRGDQFNVMLLEQDMFEVHDLYFQPDNPIYAEKGDLISLSATNTEHIQWGLRVTYGYLKRFEVPE